jgi:hypothetical protein
MNNTQYCEISPQSMNTMHEVALDMHTINTHSISITQS